MGQTVIGIFDHVAEAENAVERLTNAGFDRGLIDVSINKTAPDTNTSGELFSEEDSFGQKISLFFRAMFENKVDRDKFAAVANRSDAVVSVQTETEDDAKNVVRILDACGAIDVDARSRDQGATKQNNTPDNDSGSSRASTNPPELRTIRSEDNNTRQLEFSTTRSHIISRPADESLRLREERIRVSPNPVDKEVTEGLYSFANTFRSPKTGHDSTDLPAI